jgi:hypothetical protein
MTRQRSFKRLVRSRMEKTGESYTAARAVLLAGDEQPGPRPGEPSPLMASDDRIRERTGRGWEEWFDLLDDRGATERTHREIARWVADELGIEPLVWDAQAITHSYEVARGLRAVGETEEGFAASATRTVAVPVEQLFDAFVDESQRRSWLPDGELSERTATRPKSARFDWGDGSTRVMVVFESKGERKSRMALQHVRLPDGDEAERMKAYWRERVNGLKEELER